MRGSRRPLLAGVDVRAQVVAGNAGYALDFQHPFGWHPRLVPACYGRLIDEDAAGQIDQLQAALREERSE